LLVAVQVQCRGRALARPFLSEPDVNQLDAVSAGERQKKDHGIMPPPNSAFDEHKEELEHYEQMFGLERGRLAVSLDRLTNALVLVGQHGVYCTSQRNPMVPALDLRMVVQELVHAKELTQSVMEELRRAKGEQSFTS
jgi:hypothetical protein